MVEREVLSDRLACQDTLFRMSFLCKELAPELVWEVLPVLMFRLVTSMLHIPCNMVGLASDHLLDSWTVLLHTRRNLAYFW